MYLHLHNTCFFCFPGHIFNLGLRAGLSPWWNSEKKKCFRKSRDDERKNSPKANIPEPPEMRHPFYRIICRSLF
jgi:hypothetical protein